MIRCTLLAPLLLAISGLCAPGQPAPASANVNSRYTVETVEHPQRISRELRASLDSLVGKHYDQARVEELAQQLRRETRAAVVKHRIEKGDKPEHVKLFFETEGRRIQQTGELNNIAYHSRQGISASLEAGFDIRDLRIGVGVDSVTDPLLERYAGWHFNLTRTIADRVRLRFEFDDFHQIWNRTTRLAEGSNPDVSGVYRERRSFNPSVSIAIVPGLVYSAGIDIQHMQLQFPAVRTEAANSVENTLRLRRKWGASDQPRHNVDAGYSLRTATNSLDSDFIYTRHYADAKYSLAYGENEVILRGSAGRMSGRAPLFERFVAGNTETLRGWNKFDLDALGGSRVATLGIDYRYDNFLIFYDAGTLWDRDEARVVRHGAGAGFTGSGWFIAVAFPIRGSGVQPVFLVGTNF